MTGPILRLTSLGRLELLAGERPVLVGRRKVLGLLAYLARHSGRPVRRELLADLLWPATPDTSRQSLRQALTELREVLGPGLVADADQVTLGPATIQLDLRLVEADVGSGRWMAAAERIGGEFLPGLDYLGDEAWREWLEQERGALSRAAATVFEHLVGESEARGEWHQAYRHAERWRRVLPEDERAEAAVNRLLLFTSTPATRHAVRGLATPALIGRDSQLAVLQSAWGLAQRGEGRVVLVEAEPRYGASRLLEEFTRAITAATPRATVVSVRGYTSERHEAHGLTRAIMSRLITAPGIAGTPGELLAALQPIAPEISERFPGLSAKSQRTVAEAFHRCLVEVAAEAPLLVTVDDTDQADGESIDALRHLVRHPPGGGLLVLSGRPESWTPAVEGADVRQAAAHLNRIALDGLDESELNSLIQSMAAFDPGTAAALAGRLRQEIGGAPGHAVEILRLMVEGGELAMDDSGTWRLRSENAPLPLPPGIAERTRARMSALSEGARALLEAGATLGEPAPGQVLGAVAGLNPWQDAVGELLSRRWIREQQSHPGELAFADEASRRAVYGAIPPGRRRSLHLAAARALDRSTLPQDARAERARRHRQSARTGAPRRGLFAALAAAVALTTMLLYQWLREPDPPARAVRILLADVENRSGDSAFDRALATAATVALAESRSVRLFPRERTRETLARMGRTPTDSGMTLALAREIAERENLDAVLALTVDRVEERWVMSGRLLHPATGETLGESQRTAEGRDAVIEALDQVLTRLRRGLGESRSATGARRRLPLATTTSIEALRSYTDGREAWLRGEMVGALQHWRLAVERDSMFALALLAVSDWFYWNNYRDSGAAYLRRALSHGDRLTERERLALRAREANRVGTPEEAAARMRALAEAYPDRETWHSLAATLMRQERCGEALPATARSLEFDSLYAIAWVTRATCFQLEDRPDSALASYSRAEAAQPGYLYRGSLNQEWGRVYVRVGRLAAAESVFTAMAARSNPSDRAFGLRSQGFLSMIQGQYRGAATHFLEAAVTARSNATRLSEFRNRVLLAEALLTLRESDAARSALDRAIALTGEFNIEPPYHFFLGHALIRAGRTRDAARQLERMRAKPMANQLDRSALGLFQGLLHQARGAHDRAIVAVAEDRYEPYSAYRHSLRADAFEALGQADSALAAARLLVSGFHFGYDGQDEWMRGLLRLGRLALAAADSAEARRALSGYVERWKNGDAGLPELLWAKATLAGLQRGQR